MAEHKRSRDEQATARARLARESSLSSSFRVAVVDGVDRGKDILVGPASPGAVLVGKGSACDLVLSDPLVSRRHLSLAAQQGELHLMDLGSTNGTVVSSVRVADATLSGGEVVRIGETTLRVELVEAHATAALWPIDRFGRLLGASVAMRRIYPLCHRLAGSTVPVLVEGETGTGKELLAESLHEMGPRKSHPFVVFDCAAVEGQDILGVFEEAHGGTLLLDEIAELPAPAQAKVLRALERGERPPRGGVGDRPGPVDVRVMATSRRNVDREVERGRFREDLFFRLAATRIELPPLRQREGDVALLGTHFWTHVAEGRPLRPDLFALFEGHTWPGNVRELQSLVARKAALGDLDVPAGAPAPVAAHALGLKAFERVLEMDLPFPDARDRVLAEFERYFVERVLAQHGGNVGRAAAASGIARRYFQILRTRSR